MSKPSKARSAAIGASITLILFGAALLADFFGHGNLANLLFWPNGFLQSFILPGNIGTTENPIYEGGPLNIIVFFASFPFAFVFYSIAVHAISSYTRRRA